jgi:hypothetical protein
MRSNIRRIVVSAFLLGIIFGISTVGATVEKQSGEFFNASTYQIPDLQYDPLQAKVIVNRELSPAVEEEGSNDNIKRTFVDGSVSSTIPAGSIIYHSKERITTVFDKSGKQILSADDSQADMIPTPVGLIPATHIHTFPSGFHTYHSENVTYIISNNELIFVEIYEKPSTDEITSVSRSSESSSGSEQIILKSLTVETDQINSTMMEYAGVDNPGFYPGNDFTAQWIVPDPPHISGNLSPAYISIGVNESNSYNGHTSWRNFRPIIEYDYDQSAWLMSTCSYYRYYLYNWDSGCTNKFVVYPGDKIEGRIEYTEDTTSYPTYHQIRAIITDYNTSRGISAGSMYPVITDTISQLNINLQGDVANLNESTIIGNVTFSPVNLPASPSTYVDTSNSQLPNLNVENLWPNKIVFHTRYEPKVIEKTFSITQVGNPGWPFYGDASNQVEKLGSAASFHLSENGWSEAFRKRETEVSTEDFGTTGGGLDTTTIHFHFGHGDYDDAEEIGRRGQLALSWYTTLYPSDVKRKWGDKNKWVFLISCDTLKDDSWHDALVTSHGIIGFSTNVAPSDTFINQFFGFATYPQYNYSLVDAYQNATLTTLPKHGTAKVIFKNQDQLLYDHLPGFGTIEPDDFDDTFVTKEWKW